MDPRHLMTLMAALAALLLGHTTRADVVNPSPKDCPTWTEPGTCHAGPHCKIKECADSAACATGQTCQEQKVCVDRIDCSGRSPTPFYVNTAKGVCSPSGACHKGGTCSTVKICAAKGSLDDSDDGETPTRGCSCRLDGGGDLAPAWGLALLALVLLGRRRG